MPNVKAKRGDRVIIDNPQSLRGGLKAADRWRGKIGLVTKSDSTTVEVLLDGEVGGFVFFHREYSIYDANGNM